MSFVVAIPSNWIIWSSGRCEYALGHITQHWRTYRVQTPMWAWSFLQYESCPYTPLITYSRAGLGTSFVQLWYT